MFAIHYLFVVYFSCGLVLILGAVDTFLIHIYILYFIIFLTTFQKASVTKKTVKCDEPARIVSMRILLKIKEVLIAKIVSFKKIVPTGDPDLTLFLLVYFRLDHCCHSQT